MTQVSQIAETRRGESLFMTAGKITRPHPSSLVESCSSQAVTGRLLSKVSPASSIKLRSSLPQTCPSRRNSPWPVMAPPKASTSPRSTLLLRTLFSKTPPPVAIRPWAGENSPRNLSQVPPVKRWLRISLRIWPGSEAHLDLPTTLPTEQPPPLGSPVGIASQETPRREPLFLRLMRPMSTPKLSQSKGQTRMHRSARCSTSVHKDLSLTFNLPFNSKPILDTKLPSDSKVPSDSKLPPLSITSFVKSTSR